MFPPDEEVNLLNAVRGSRLVMVTMETVGITTGVYAFIGATAVGVSGVGDTGDSITGEAGDSNVGEAGDSSIGEAGDSTIISFGESMMWNEDSICEGGGESIRESGGAFRGESSLADFFQNDSFLSCDTDSLSFFLAGSSTSAAGIWPLRTNKKQSNMKEPQIKIF